ncbi:MAG: hypothetical protein LBP59_11785 [Planctomycetaceae bacterium]|nr:hypothetical protein [Planctomycetaceae bacterium]
MRFITSINFYISLGLKYNYFRPSEVIKFISAQKRNAAFRRNAAYLTNDFLETPKK